MDNGKDRDGWMDNFSGSVQKALITCKVQKKKMLKYRYDAEKKDRKKLLPICMKNSYIMPI